MKGIYQKQRSIIVEQRRDVMLSKDNTVIGFIGTGVMGSSMASHLLDASYPVLVFNRTKEKANALLEKGAHWRDSIIELASEADVIITILGFPDDVEETYLGPNGIIDSARPGTYLIDMTTSSPMLAKKIHEGAKTRHMYALDAPVSGGDIGARKGELTIMVGGDDWAYSDVESILNIMGSNVILQGPAGSGQYTKMCNQIAIASTMMGVTEAITYAERAGLDPHRVLESISTGAAGSWSLSNLVPRMMQEDFAPGFYIKHFIKDMKIAVESAEELGLSTPGLCLAKSLYEQLAERGEDSSGTQALYKYYKENA
ncbi:NAD(P)-dependent oxidoreductase [Bacillus alkalicellulosilyticus]|uniref:NAD(P)-dependent oxidoreductase n=1 Tax=Alkalihalobacterium alkalicellulosilyticum TaxID=1912214 RepID=UPI002481FE8F|nr:NAD(P)-dependent oxidoreductase [Bacillus alkalicellulosilyticus]